MGSTRDSVIADSLPTAPRSAQTGHNSPVNGVPQTGQARLLFVFTTFAFWGFKCCSRFSVLWLAQKRDRRHERRIADCSNRNERKEPGQLRGSNQIFRSLQLPIQILKGATEVI